MSNNLNQILAAREKRYQLRLDLHKKHNLPVVVITLNIPGPNKSSQLINRVFRQITAEITGILSEQNIIIEQDIIRSTFAGPEAFMVLDLKDDCTNLKEKLIKIEQNHYLGRLLDLDLYRSDSSAVSRKSIDKKQRKCLLCEQNARKCIIEKNHSLNELQEKINEMLLKYLENPSGSV